MKTLQKTFRFFWQHQELVLLFLILVISAVAHWWNMFHFPYYENDEGVYFSQAWSFFSQGKLAPYTYWYDHAPVGWMFTSIWIFLTGGLFTFGFALKSARIFVWLLHVFSTFLLFKITKKITKSNVAAVVTCVFFALSPLAIYFQRRLLLDNIMTFWLLLTIYIILYARRKLFPFLLSALTFGIAALSKENAVFFLPVLIGFVAVNSHKKNRVFAIFLWICMAGMVISFYPLYALLKGELFPVGSAFSPNYAHVSLLGTLAQQASRGSGLPFWADKSDFMTNLKFWYQKGDPFFIAIGFICVILQGVQSFFFKKSRSVFLLVASILAFLMSGKLVINFYVIPLIPFMSMCIGWTAAEVTNFLKKLHPFVGFIAAILILIGIGEYYTHSILFLQTFSKDDNAQQLIAVNWMKQNLPSTEPMAIDYYANLDLTESRFLGDPKFSNAYWYWKVEPDPDIRLKKLHDDSTNLHYMMLTSQMYTDMLTFPRDDSLLWKALDNSSEIKAFLPTSEPFTLKDYPIDHPNGDWVVIFKQNTMQDTLSLSWQSYVKNFVTADGRTIDPRSPQITSRNQAFTLLRAALNNDEKTFDTVYNWSRQNLLLKDKNLFSTSYQTQFGSSSTDPDTSTDADEDTAYAMLIAYKRWKNPLYLKIAKAMIGDIWQYETVALKGQRILVAGTWTSQPGNAKFVMNPSYFAPYEYRIFDEVDSEHNWQKVIDSSYKYLDLCSSDSLQLSGDTAYLPPNWCSISSAGHLVPATNIDPNFADYSYDAIHIPWRISVDYALNKEDRALSFLQKITTFQNDWQQQKKIFGGYHHDGTAIDTNESLEHYDSQLTAFSITNPMIASQIFNQEIGPKHGSDNNTYYWGDPQNISEQNWTWLGLAVYSGNFENWWTK